MTATDTEQRPAAASFRFEDSRLLNALDVYAKRTRRSRNKAVEVLLEEAMRQEGLWPPPEAEGGDE